MNERDAPSFAIAQCEDSVNELKEISTQINKLTNNTKHLLRYKTAQLLVAAMFKEKRHAEAFPHAQFGVEWTE